jgi:DNA-binding XRE family transcriptional regulator
VTRIGEHELIHSPREDVCVSCGTWVLDPVHLAVIELGSAKRILSAEKLTGAIIKDVRRLIGIPRAEVAQRLGVAEAVVGGWEQGEGTYERWLPLALIGLLDLAMKRELGFPMPDV